MNRLTDNDRNLGPFTLARWKGSFGVEISSGDHDENRGGQILITAFGWALRIQIPALIKPFGKYREHERVYGFTLSDMGNGYDFLQVFYGPRTHDSSTEKTWCKHLPWKQWECVRNSVYEPDGTLFATEERGKKRGDIFEFMRIQEKCPKSHFGFEDYDGEMIVAECTIEEMEWHCGEGWFKWLKWFYPAKIRRSLDIKFSAEVGPEKGSWKGGTLGHGIEMQSGETPRNAFERYCQKEHEQRGRKFRIRFIGPCDPVVPVLRSHEELPETSSAGIGDKSTRRLNIGGESGNEPFQTP